MTGCVDRFAGARGIAASAIICAAVATLVAACAAAVVGVAGIGDDVRRTLLFDFAGVEHTPATALAIALQNARLVAATLLCAAVVPRLPQPVRLLAHLLLAIVLAANAGLVGVALGAYGARLAAPHLPVELAALILAGAAYMHASRHPLGMVAIAVVAATCALLLVIAATLETYGAPGGAA
jgi:hypothetical protein